jgi:hypothetical protein
MKQVQRVYHFVVSGFCMVLIGPIWLGIYQCSVFLPLLFNKKSFQYGDGVQLQWNFASAKEILHIFYTFVLFLA